MRVHRLSVRHIRGARRIDIHNPSPAVVELSGDNGAGKSSALDAIEWGVRGKRALPEAPLHRDATRGRVELDLGDVRIVRQLTEANAERGGTVRIEAADGRKLGQRDLDGLWGTFTFDPLAFAALKPEAQVAQLRALAGADFSAALEALDNAIAQAERDRADAGREVKRYGRIADVPRAERVDTAELADRMRAARQAADVRARSAAALESTAREVQARRTALARLVEQVEDERSAIITCEGAMLKMRERLEALPEPEDMAAIERDMAEASERNAAAARYEAAEAERSKLSDAVREHEERQAAVEDLRERRRQHLRTATLPVDGLSWEGGKIALNGTPFKALSTTEQLLLSARIGMAASPELRVMMIRDGGLVDNLRFAALAELAEREGYQVWVETAGAGHTPEALEIREGELVQAAAGDDWSE